SRACRAVRHLTNAAARDGGSYNAQLDRSSISDSVLGLMRVSRIFLSIMLICASAFASESRLPFGTVFKGQAQFNRLVSLAKENNWKSLPIGERTAAVGQALTGTRYKSY